MVFLLALCLIMCYNINMVVGQTAINYLEGHKMWLDDLSVIVFTCLVLYALIFAKGPNDG